MGAMCDDGGKTVGRDTTTLGILEPLLLVDPLMEASLRAFFPYQRLVKEIEERRKRDGWRGEKR